MPITSAELKALGCPCDGQGLDAVVKWLELHQFDTCRDLQGAGDLRKLKGALLSVVCRLFVCPYRYAAGADAMPAEGVRFLGTLAVLRPKGSQLVYRGEGKVARSRSPKGSGLAVKELEEAIQDLLASKANGNVAVKLPPVNCGPRQASKKIRARRQWCAIVALDLVHKGLAYCRPCCLLKSSVSSGG